jgi:hypothetical protein
MAWFRMGLGLGLTGGLLMQRMGYAVASAKRSINWLIFGLFACSPGAHAAEGPPVISSAGPNIVGFPGGNYKMDVSATGTLPLSYQWGFEGQDIENATNSILVLSNIDYAEAGHYSIRVKNDFGEDTRTNLEVRLFPVATWTLDYRGPTYFPSELTNVTEVATTYLTSMVLKTDGSVQVWGPETIGVLDVPSSLTNVVSISAGYEHCLALTSDGNVVQWGKSVYPPEIPASVTNVVAIAAGESQNMALRADGKVIVWGLAGPLHLSFQDRQPDMPGIVAIAASEHNCYALSAEGELFAWGFDSSANLLKVPANLKRVVAFSVGYRHVMALQEDRTIVSWGSGLFATNIPPSVTNVVAISAGYMNGLALLEDGHVAFFGYPPAPIGLRNVRRVAAGRTANFAVIGDGSPTLATPIMPITISTHHRLMIPALATGEGELHYQWFKDGVIVPGATNWEYVIEDAPITASGIYSIRIENEVGTYLSRDIVVKVQDMPVPLLVNAKLDGNMLTTEIQNNEGIVYSIEYKNELSEPDWILLKETRGTNGILNIEDVSQQQQTQRFYRIKQ